MNYYYSQRYSGYKNWIIARNLTMEHFGCVITDCAMLLSYFNDRPFYPDQMLRWLQNNNGLTADGRIYWNKITEASGGKLRYSLKPDPKDGELTYGLRQVYFGRYNHWVFDHPLISNKVIDPWDGKVKDYSAFRYTGQNRFFIGRRG